MKKLTISVLFLLFHCVLMSPQRHLHMNSTHVNCLKSYHIKLGSKNRPGPQIVLPIDQQKRFHRNINLARHHIIPYNVLRGFYNRLITNEHHFRNLFENVLVAAGYQAGGFVDYSLDNLRNVPLGELPLMFRHHVEHNLEQDRHFDLVRELYTWMPFNIFIGPVPDMRNDDPGENFENNAHVIVGQLRLDQLRRIQTEMVAYTAGTNTNPTDLLNEIGGLLRTTPLPYDFNGSQWRYNIYVERPYNIATDAVISNYQNIPLDDEDYCHDDEFAFLQNYYPPNFGGRRSRRVAQENKPCLVRDKGAVYDRYCINSLNVLRELIKESILTLHDDEITFNSVAVPEETKPKIPHSACNPAVGLAGGVVTGAVSAFAMCLALGGIYIPFLGWAGCAAGSAVYVGGGTAVGTTIGISLC